MPNPRYKATLLGFLAMGFWSTNVAITRALVEQLGPFTTLAVNFGGAGLILLTLDWIRWHRLTSFSSSSGKYLLFCGLLFVGYCATYATSFSLAPDRQVALQLGIVNYLWPGLTLIFSIAFFHYRTRWLILFPGIVLGLLGVGMAASQTLSWSLFVSNMLENRVAFLLMLGAAVSWGLYSNVSRFFAPASGTSGVPIFQLASGFIFLMAALLVHERPTWSWSVIGTLCYSIVFPTALGYWLWDKAVQRGDLILLGAVSYLMPLVSTFFGCWYLEEPVTRNLVAGSLLVIVGAVLCKAGIRETAGDHLQNTLGQSTLQNR